MHRREAWARCGEAADLLARDGCGNADGAAESRGLRPQKELQMEIEWYAHHGVQVAVRKDLKGQHRQHCLCYLCEHFIPESRADNCPTANLLYAVCIREGITTPVWECLRFTPKGGA